MARQWMTPGGFVIDEDGEDEYMLPVGFVINEDQAAAGDVSLLPRVRGMRHMLVR